MICIGSDHRGYKIKEEIIKYFKEKKFEIKDFGTYNEERVDYPKIAERVSRAVLEDNNNFGILICGTGIGMSIVANKFKGIRCGLCYNEYTAKYAKAHNNCNIIAIGAENLKLNDIICIIRTFIASKFENGRHLERLNYIENIEENNMK